MSSTIAQRYAKALFAASVEPAQMELIHRDLELVGQLLKDSPVLARFLENPIIPTIKCRAVLSAVFHGKIDALTYRFLLFLATKKRLPYLKSICIFGGCLYDEARGILKAQCLTARALTQDTTLLVTDYLKERFKKDIKIQYTIDHRLLGGVKIRIGDTVYDYSLQAQLKEFQQAVMNA